MTDKAISGTDSREYDRLLPCPFCGSEPECQHFNISPHLPGRIICSCGAEMRQGRNQNSAELVAAWNTRADSEESEYYNGYEQLMNRCADLTTLLRDMFPLLNKDLLDKSDRDMLVSCNDRCIELLGIDEVEHG